MFIQSFVRCYFYFTCNDSQHWVVVKNIDALSTIFNKKKFQKWYCETQCSNASIECVRKAFLWVIEKKNFNIGLFRKLYCVTDKSNEKISIKTFYEWKTCEWNLRLIEKYLWFSRSRIWMKIIVIQCGKASNQTH